MPEYYYSISDENYMVSNGVLWKEVEHLGKSENIPTPPILTGRDDRKAPVEEEVDEPTEEEMEALQPIVPERPNLSPKGKRLDHTTRQEIMKRIVADVQPRDIMAEFNISPGTVSNIKHSMKISAPAKSVPFSPAERVLIPRTNYICDIGHRFVSNLPIGKAMCLSCKSRNIKVAEEKPVVES